MPTKGEETRDRILEHAVRMGSRDGLGGLTIGALAEELGMSKSGLFAHFGSKEDLQVAALEAAAREFEQKVLRAAFKAPRGRVRLERLFETWLRWMTDPAMPGGCIFLAASSELDDKPGKPRDYLVGAQKELLDTIAKAARLAVDTGELQKEVDVAQFAFEMDAIMLGFNHAKRLMRDPHAEKRARAAFTRLLDSATVHAARRSS